MNDNIVVSLNHECSETVFLITTVRDHHNLMTLVVLLKKGPYNEGIPHMFCSQFHPKSPAPFLRITELILREVGFYICTLAVPTGHPMKQRLALHNLLLEELTTP